MSEKVELRLDWCSYQAAKFAVEHWHYSKRMPTPPSVYIGVWENKKYIGCVIFGRGANNNLGKPYGLDVTQVCELTRVALAEHIAPVSKIISVCIKMLKRKEIGLRLIVSFADANENHIGGIYQAGNWIYSGRSNSTPKYKTKDGHTLHQRQVSKNGIKPQYGTLRVVPKIADCEIIPQLDKYRYLYPLDEAMRAQIEPLRKPYPKRGEGETDNAAQSNEQTEGARPISPLLQDPALPIRRLND